MGTPEDDKEYCVFNERGLTIHVEKKLLDNPEIESITLEVSMGDFGKYKVYFVNKSVADSE